MFLEHEERYLTRMDELRGKKEKREEVSYDVEKYRTRAYD